MINLKPFLERIHELEQENATLKGGKGAGGSLVGLNLKPFLERIHSLEQENIRLRGATGVSLSSGPQGEFEARAAEAERKLQQLTSLVDKLERQLGLSETKEKKQNKSETCTLETKEKKQNKSETCTLMNRTLKQTKTNIEIRTKSTQEEKKKKRREI